MEDKEFLDDQVFYVFDDKGNKVECDILFTFDIEELNNKYVVYTDRKIESDGKMNLYASTYKSNKSGGFDLEPVKSDEEWKVIETVLKTTREEMKDTGSSEEINKEA